MSCAMSGLILLNHIGSLESAAVSSRQQTQKRRYIEREDKKAEAKPNKEVEEERRKKIWAEAGGGRVGTIQLQTRSTQDTRGRYSKRQTDRQAKQQTGPANQSRNIAVLSIQPQQCDISGTKCQILSFQFLT
jgi:hypothetical protein